MTKSLRSLSEEIQELAARWGPSVLEVRGRRGAPSSGIAWSKDGFLIAAEHTLEHDEGIEVRSSTGESFRSEIHGRDPSTGIAVLRAENASLTPPEWRRSEDVRPGELALVVAASPRPAGRVALTTVSVAGSEWHTEAGTRIERYLETEARLFPGFSGSLLVGASGGLAIGMNTAGLRRRTPIAIPAETLARVAKSLLEHGEVRRGFLGITTYPLRLPGRASQRVGLLVLSVEPGSPADQAPLFLGDVILRMDSRIIDSPAALLSLLTEDRIGKTIEARILRSGNEQSISIVVGKRS